MSRDEALEILAQCALSSFVNNVAQPRLRAALEIYFAEYDKKITVREEELITAWMGGPLTGPTQ
jgi:hypothetical protein